MSSSPRCLRSFTRAAAGLSVRRQIAGKRLDGSVVSVPRLAAQEDLHEPHAPLDESPGDQAARAVLARRILVESVEAANVGRLGRDVECLFRGRLHGGGQLVAANPGFEVGLARMRSRDAGG